MFCRCFRINKKALVYYVGGKPVLHYSMKLLMSFFFLICNYWLYRCMFLWHKVFQKSAWRVAVILLLDW